MMFHRTWVLRLLLLDIGVVGVIMPDEKVGGNMVALLIRCRGCEGGFLLPFTGLRYDNSPMAGRN